MKKEIITISGLPGSGKSSTADKVAQTLNYARFSSGDFMRRLALKKGITLNELSKIAENDNGYIDNQIDNEVTKLNNTEKIVVDSRLAFHFLNNSFKVFLDLAPEISKNRVINNLKTNQLRAQTEGLNNPEEVYEKIIERLNSEKKRYKELYNLDYTQKENFDLVIDTEKNNLDQVVNIILAEYKKWLEN